MVAAWCAVSGAWAQAKPVWMTLFDGKSLARWGYSPDYWYVDSGMVRGQGKSAFNTFCHADQKYSDFVLSFKARLWQTKAGYTNSGMQYRSVFIDSIAHRMKGYQMDIGDSLDGFMYPEGGYPAGATMLGTDSCKKAINANGWNHYLITANGAKVRHEVNGKVCIEYTGSVPDGYIGMQLHATTLVMKVDFKDIFIRPLNNSFPIPAELATTLDDSYASTGVLARGRIAPPLPRFAGCTLTLPAGFWSGKPGVVRVAVNDANGRLIFGQAVAGAGLLPALVPLPALAPGAHVLNVSGAGGNFSGLVR